MLIFWTIAGISLALLVLTAVVGDFLDGIFDSIDFGDGWLSSTAVLSFLATFGLTGGILLATTDLPAALAAIAAVVVGLLFGLGAGAATRALANGKTAHQITTEDYLDQVATVTTSIPNGGLGQVHLVLAGHPTSIAARADGPIAQGVSVVIISNLGPGLVKVAAQA